MRGNERPVLDATLQVTLARGLQLPDDETLAAAGLTLQVTLARGLQRQTGNTAPRRDGTFKSHLRADCNG